MHNCPFRHLAELQPKVVCHMNLTLVQGLVTALGIDLDREERRVTPARMTRAHADLLAA
jgi:predicted ArsR family transcriptional regulator